MKRDQHVRTKHAALMVEAVVTGRCPRHLDEIPKGYCALCVAATLGEPR